MSWPGVYTQRGVFVCLEGGEGSGKSTQARLLADRLAAEGYDVVLTFEPGGTDVGAKIRRVLLDPETESMAHRAEALLFAADKAEHVERVITPALARGAVVVTDRYVDTALAYQGGARDLDLADVEHINRWATGDLRPHLTVVLDVDPELGLGRFTERDRLEGESLEFHRLARDAFLAIAKGDPDRYLVLDAQAPVEDIAALIAERVAPLLEQAVRA